jgi:hypothetical protein
MTETTTFIIWWFGAVAAMATLALTALFLLRLTHAVVLELGRELARIVRISTARYWCSRMEREGLTICMKEYRKMVAASNPKTAENFEQIEQEWNLRDKA